MEPRGPSLRPERLLEHAAWARRIARELVADAATADDVVQEAWLAATRKPPPESRPLRSWLGKVLRNAARQRARSEGRRSAREVAAAREESLPGPDELVERLDSQRALTEELAKLEEPFRSTVLLRYFEDLEPSQIAAKQGLPAGTVRWRLKRGMDELRARLDARFGGRQRWALLLAPLARLAPPPVAAPAPTAAASPTTAPVVLPGGAAAVTGAVIMNLGVKVAAGAAAALLAVVGGLMLGGVEPRDVLPWLGEKPVAVAFHPLAPTVQPPVADPQPAAREAISAARVEVAPPSEAAAPVAEERTTMVLLAGAFDSVGAPLAGATLRSIDALGEPSPPSGSDGALRLELEVRHLGEVTVLVERAGFATALAHARPEPGAEVYLGNFRLEQGGAISGRVLDPDGSAVAGALISIGEASPSRGELEDRRFQFYVDQAPRALTQADGSFLLLGVPAGFVRVWASGPHWLASASAPVEVRAGLESAGVTVQIEPLTDSMQVRAVVLDPGGQPVPHAAIEFEQREDGNVMRGGRMTDANGHFEWVIHPDARLDLTATDPEHRYGPATARELAGGQVDVELRLTPLRQVQLAVRSRAGAPVERFAIELFEAEGGMGLDGPEHIEGEETSVEDHAGGVAELALPEHPFELGVRAPGFALHRSGALQPASIGEEIAVTLEPLPGLRGRVLRSGEPVAGARVELFALPEENEHYERGPFDLRVDPDARDRASTDAEGAFFLTPRERARFVVRAEREGFAPSEFGPFEIDPKLGRDGVVLELGPGGAIEGRVHVPPGPDAAGTLVGISRGDGDIQTRRVGTDGAFRFERLTPGTWQVRSIESESWGTSCTIGAGAPPAIVWDCAVEEGGTTRYDLDLTGAERTWVAGTLRFDGQPSEGWKAILCEGSTWAGDSAAQAGVDPAGVFVLEAPRPGPHYVVLETSEGPLGERAFGLPIELGPGETPLALELATGSLAIENLVGEQLVLMWSGPGDLVHLIKLAPDANGRCELNCVPVGANRVTQMAEVPDPMAWPVLATVEVAKGKQASVRLP